MISFSLSDLFSASTVAQIYQFGLDVASSLGVPVTSWRAGDPTRSLYHYVSRRLGALEDVAVEYTKGGYLDYASDKWLTLLAQQQFNVTRRPASAAAGELTLTNTAGGVFFFDAEDLTFRSTVTGKTYHNTSGGSLSGVGASVVLSFVADEDGSDSSVAVNEVDQLVTSLAGVSVTSSTAAYADDEEEDSSLRQRCRDSRGALSPNGPWDAYRYVVLNTELTGSSELTKAAVASTSTTGNVVVTVAGPSGAVSGAALTAAQNAIVKWCTPLTVTPTVQNATNLPITVSYAVTLRSSVGVTAAAAETLIEAMLTDFVADYPVGGDSGALDGDLLSGTVFSAYGAAHTASITRTSPAALTAMTTSQVLTLAAPVSVTVTIV